MKNNSKKGNAVEKDSEDNAEVRHHFYPSPYTSENIFVQKTVQKTEGTEGVKDGDRNSEISNSAYFRRFVSSFFRK